MTRGDMTNFVAKYGSEFIVIGQFQQRRGCVNVTAGQREAVYFLHLYDMEFVEQIWPDARTRAPLTDALDAIQSHICQVAKRVGITDGLVRLSVGLEDG